MWTAKAARSRTTPLFGRDRLLINCHVVLPMRSVPAPSIAPPHGAATVYLVLDDFGPLGRAYRQTEDRTGREAVIENLLTGQYENPLGVVAFNTAEGWSRDASPAHLCSCRADYGLHELEHRWRECQLFGARAVEHLRVSMERWPDLFGFNVCSPNCWKSNCQARTRIVTFLEVRVGPHRCQFTVACLGSFRTFWQRLRAHSPVFPRGHHQATLQPRTLGQSYVSNGCYRCDAFRRLLRGAANRAGHGGNRDEEWRRRRVKLSIGVQNWL
jgi:hypothetical protein